LYKSIDGTDIVGPISGTIRGSNPFDINAKNLQAEIDRVRQTVGKAIEGGVLRKEDEEKYKKIMPTLKDPKDVALSKLQQLYIKLNQDLENYVDLQTKHGKGRGVENILTPVQTEGINL
jgi:hypothetical protein